MSKPVIVQTEPYEFTLEPGNYYWCQCGLSNNQPFCDGSHSTTEFEPIKLTVEKTKKYFLCGCKHTAKQPFCDGTHQQLR